MSGWKRAPAGNAARMRSRYSSASRVVVTGGLRLGITMARAKRRAVSGSTARRCSPSRKCRCQSSGRVSVIFLICRGMVTGNDSRITLLQIERALVELVLLLARYLCSKVNRLLERQFREQGRQRALRGAVARFCLFTGPFHDQDELPFALVGVGGEPGFRFRQRTRMQRFEQLGQLACKHDAAAAAQRRVQIGDGFGNSMRRLVEHQREGKRGEGSERPAAGGSTLGQETVEQEMRRGQSRGG